MFVPWLRGKERATPQTVQSTRVLRVAPLSPLRGCLSVTDHFRYALSSRLGETKNRQQRGMAEHLNRLLDVRTRQGLQEKWQLAKIYPASHSWPWFLLQATSGLCMLGCRGRYPQPAHELPAYSERTQANRRKS